MKRWLIISLYIFSHFLLSCEEFDDTPSCVANNTGELCINNTRDQGIRILIDGEQIGTVDSASFECFNVSIGPKALKIKKDKLLDLFPVIMEKGIVINQCEALTLEVD